MKDFNLTNMSFNELSDFHDSLLHNGIIAIDSGISHSLTFTSVILRLKQQYQAEQDGLSVVALKGKKSELHHFVQSLVPERQHFGDYKAMQEFQELYDWLKNASELSRSPDSN